MPAITGPAGRRSGLALLGERRPDVLHAYLDLQPLLGRSLNGVTKELIRIALAAQSGSERGLRCGVPRALAQGASADQVVDAVVLALPEGGLGRVADALGVLAEFLDDPHDADLAATRCGGTGEPPSDSSTTRTP
jgi:alkylhydroperoxidase/carboxymuconolactone decarboxylase family protein YurZ